MAGWLQDPTPFVGHGVLDKLLTSPSGFRIYRV